MRRSGRTNHEHSSSRYDRTPLSLWRAILAYVVGFRDVVTFTEVASDPRWDVTSRLTGWKPIRGSGGGGREECGAIVKLSKWRVVSSSTVPLSRRVVPSRNQRVFALVVVLEHRRTRQRVRYVVAHLPAHVEEKFWQDADDPQVICYRECVAALSTIARSHFPGTTMIVCDWNLSWRRGWVRTYLRTQFPDYSWTFGGGRLPRSGGTHGGRLIDYTATNGTFLRANLAADDGSSDHRPYVEVVKLRG